MEYDCEYDSEGSVEEYRDWWLDADQRADLSDEELVDKMVSDTLYHEESFEMFLQDIGLLLDRLDTTDGLYYISGENIGWRSRSGETIERISTPLELVKLLTPNGSYSIKYTFEDDCLYCRVFGHDAPSGSPFKVLPVTDSSVVTAFESGGREAALEKLHQ